MPPTQEELAAWSQIRCADCWHMVTREGRQECSEPHVLAVPNCMDPLPRTIQEERSQDTSFEYPCGKSGALFASKKKPKPTVPDDYSSWRTRTHQR